MGTFSRTLLAVLVLVGSSSCGAAKHLGQQYVNWGDGDGWHWSRSGFEDFLAAHMNSYAECPGVYPGIEVNSAKLDVSLLNRWVTPDCKGDFSGAVREAITAAGFTTLKLPPGRLFKVLLYSETSIKCGTDFHDADNCVSVVHGDVAILASWQAPHTTLKKAFIALRDGPPPDYFTSHPGARIYEWSGKRLSLDSLPGSEN